MQQKRGESGEHQGSSGSCQRNRWDKDRQCIRATARRAEFLRNPLRDFDLHNPKQSHVTWLPSCKAVHAPGTPKKSRVLREEDGRQVVHKVAGMLVRCIEFQFHPLLSHQLSHGCRYNRNSLLRTASPGHGIMKMTACGAEKLPLVHICPLSSLLFTRSWLQNLLAKLAVCL